MRFQYSTIDPSQNEFDSLPRLPLILHQIATASTIDRKYLLHVGQANEVGMFPTS